MRRLVSFGGAALGVLAAGLAVSNSGASEPHTGARPVSATLVGHKEKPLSAILRERKATALVFVGCACPIANASAPELAELSRKMEAKGGRVILVYSNPGERDDIASHVARYGLEKVPRIVDTDQTIARTVGAKVTPEAVVYDASGKVRYRGRINDAFIARAKPRGTGASRHDLALAMDAVIAGKPAPSSVKAVGCVIEKIEPAVAAPTYSGDVAKILNDNCVSCHRDGEIGPMPLATYAQARKFADNIVSVTQQKVMPPWKPVEGHGDFSGVRKLTDAQLDTLARWSKAGAPAGDMGKVPAAPHFAKGWRLGEPDLVLKMPEAWQQAASGPDIYRCFVLPTGLTEDKEVVAVEYRAGNKSVVHHVLGYVDDKGIARKMDEKDPGPGYTSFGGPGFAFTGEMGGWAPGNLPNFLPEGIARPLPAGSDLVIQVHYHPTGKVESDITQVGLYFAKKKAAKKLRMYPLIAPLNIPPGESSYTTSGTMPIPFNAQAIAITPHMHLLGKKISVVANLPDGTKKPMVRIDDWDFNWQDNYWYKQPFDLPKGTTLTLTATYDNSAKNPRQPNNPPIKVGWGEATTDEMCLAFVAFVVENEEDPMVKMMDRLLKRAQSDDGFAGQLLGRKKP